MKVQIVKMAEDAELTRVNDLVGIVDFTIKGKAGDIYPFFVEAIDKYGERFRCCDMQKFKYIAKHHPTQEIVTVCRFLNKNDALMFRLSLDN